MIQHQNIPERKNDDMTANIGSSCLKELIADLTFATLTTREPDGALRSRPMVNQEMAKGGPLWFFTGSDTHKASDIRNDPHVNVGYTDPVAQRCISVNGIARIINDRRKMRQLWRPAYARWLPLGIDDPDMALLEVGINHVNSWYTGSTRNGSTWAGHTHEEQTPVGCPDHDEGRHTP